MSNFEKLLNELKEDKSGKSFEVFCKWFLENDPYWKTQVEKVWLWDDWPERWDIDKGIDLVFKHKNGQNWAVQSKCYSEDYYIKKEDIDSFLSESSRKQIHQRLLIGTTDRIGKNATETMNGQEKPVRSFLLNDLKASGLDYPSSLKGIGSKGNKKKINKDRPYQQQAIKQVLEGFKSHDRGKLIMACGTGKTLVTLWIKEKLKPQTTLVLLPSLNLLSQTLFEWTTHSKEAFEVLCICSDTTVGKQDRNEDMKVTDAYFDVTSDVSTISQFFKLDKPKVIFCTYQSSDLVSQAQKKEEIDLVVCDEAHRCTGLAKSTFTRVLDNKNIKAKKRLFTTATPRIFASSVKTIAAKEGKEIYGMDDEDIYGPDFFEYTFGQAIDDEWLTDYQVVIVGVDEPTVKASIDERELIAIDDDRYEDAETLASKISVAKAIKDYDITRMITFHNRVKDAQNFSKDFQDILKLLTKKHKPRGMIWTDYISGQMTTKDRKLKLQQLKELSTSERGIISNAKCLSEGVDVPTLDGVAFVDPKGSQIDIIQSVGRALRKSEEKNVGTIILPVFLNKDADEIQTIENSNFKPVWDVLKALRSHDERLSDELDNIRINIGRRKKRIRKIFHKKILFDLPKSFNNSFTESLQIVLVEHTTERWMFWYGLLKNIYEGKNLTFISHVQVTDDGHKIGIWVDTQRQNYKNGKLSQDRIDLLEKIPGWIWDINEYQWQEGYKNLRVYIKKYKFIPPQRYVSDEGYNLGAWVNSQRFNYKKGILSPGKIIFLEKFLEWSWDPFEDIWKQGYGYLKDYVIAHKKICFLDYMTRDGFNLGRWINTQRQAYKKEKLDQNKVSLLENLPTWSWDPMEDAWKSQYELFANYLSIKGNNISGSEDLLVKKKFKSWRNNQITKYNKNKLSSEKIALLEKLPGWTWDQIEFQWQENYKKVKDYVNSNNKIPSKGEVDRNVKKLGNWIVLQRAIYKKGILSNEKIILIEKIRGWVWEPIASQWQEGYRNLKLYIQNHKSICSQSFVTDDGYKLGIWVSGQRTNYSRNTLPQDRINLLEQLLEWSWNPLEVTWQNGYVYLKNYIEKNQKLPSISYETKDGYKLGNWVYVQRTNYRNNKLSTEKITMLEKLSGWIWDPLEFQWQEGYNKLKEYVNLYNKMPLKEDSDANVKKLGSWMHKQRSNYKKGILSKEKVQMIENIQGWTWDQIESQWQEGYGNLKLYIQKYNSICSQSFVTDDGYKLGTWVGTQRTTYKQEKLAKDKIILLEKLPGWWWVFKKQ